MFLDDNTATEVISSLATIQRHVMTTMLASGEDFQELQPALAKIIDAQGVLTDALDSSKQVDEEFETLISKVRVETAE
jgi:hypothetical protein